MSGSANEVLRDIIDRHGRILLDNRRRCEGCLRDTSLADKEIAGLMAALKAGIPKRLAAIPDGALSEKGAANFAAELSESSGLSDQIALRSVEAWAFALRQTRSEPKQGDDKRKEEAVPAVVKASLFEAICGAIGLVFVFWLAYALPKNQMEFTIPGFIFALVVFVKSVQAISNYAEFRWKGWRAGRNQGPAGT